MNIEIKLGLPKGSLNTPDRGNTEEMLLNAGYDIHGYEPKKESDSRLAIANDREIKPFLTRPQSAPVELMRGYLDLAIIGEDWVNEETTRRPRSGIRKIGDLDYGTTRLVIALPDTSPCQSLSDFFLFQTAQEKSIVCFTEFINLTRQRFMRNEAYQAIYGSKTPKVQVRSLTNGSNKLVQILYSDGVTEGFIAKGANIIADITQSGNSLKEYGLKEVEQIMESSVGLYAGPTCIG